MVWSSLLVPVALIAFAVSMERLESSLLTTSGAALPSAPARPSDQTRPDPTRPAQPRSAQPRSAQPRSAQPRSAQPRPEPAERPAVALPEPESAPSAA